MKRKKWKEREEPILPDFRQGIMAEAVVIKEDKFLYYSAVNNEIRIIDESKIPNAIKSRSRDFVNPLWTGY